LQNATSAFRSRRAQDLRSFGPDYNAPSTLEEIGQPIVRYKTKALQSLIDASVREIEIAGAMVPIMNCPPMWASAAGAILSQGKPFSVTYHDTSEGRVFSLRSSKGSDSSMNVAEVAEFYGGGGHKHASGFIIPSKYSVDAVLKSEVIMEHCRG